MKTVTSIVVSGGLLLSTGWTQEVSVTLSDGSSLRMVEPPDMMGATWEAVGTNLPAVFLMVESGGDENTKLQQMLRTVQVVGSLFAARHDRALGSDGEFADLAQVEKILRDDKAGKTDPQTSQAIRKGEAVAFWSAMLSDYATSKGVGRRVDQGGGANLTSDLIKQCFQQIKQGQDVDIYSKVLQFAKRDNPAQFETFLGEISPDDRHFVDRVLETKQ